MTQTFYCPKRYHRGMHRRLRLPFAYPDTPGLPRQYNKLLWYKISRIGSWSILGNNAGMTWYRTFHRQTLG